MITLRQLSLLQAIVKNAFNLSAAARACHTSQPGASRQVALLEQELGVKLLLRRKNRILDLTAVGQEILSIANQMLNQAENIKLIAADERGDSGGRLIVATSHLHARYTLRNPAKSFSRKYPNVELQLLQADPENIVSLVERGLAHIGISTLLPSTHQTLLLLQSALIKRSAIVPKGHALSHKKRLSLNDLARHPIVGYHAESTAGRLLASTFKSNGFVPRFVVSANDSDVIKTYVSDGFGIAIVPTLSLDDAGRDALTAIDVTSLFPKTFMTICLRQDRHLRNYLTDFISLISPEWTRRAIQHAISARERTCL